MRLLKIAFVLALLGAGLWLTLWLNWWPSWREEVLMHSGETFTVHRSATMARHTSGGAFIWSWVYMEGAIEVAPTRDRPSPPKLWSSKYPPLIIDLDHDGNRSEWFIVAILTSCYEWTVLGSPRLPYLEFRYRDGQWVQQPLSEKFIGRAANLLAPIASRSVPDQTVEMKSGRINDSWIPADYTRLVSQWDHCG